MATEDLEALGGCMAFEQQDSAKSMAKIIKNLSKNPENVANK
jgi:UDP-N-acetylglucosamine:LPS N-acetylglucosamine transferase